MSILNGCRDCQCDNDEKSTIEKSVNEEEHFFNDGSCKKCKCNGIEIFIRKKDGYCKTCFLINTTHKFRANLGKSKIIRKGDTVLIDYRGTESSTVLLHLIKSGMNESAHKKIIFEPVVLYVDDSVVKGHGIEEKKNISQEITLRLKELGFTGYTTSLGECLNENTFPKIYSIGEQRTTTTTMDTNEPLLKILDNLPNDTARIELLRRLRHRLLIHCARKLNCNKIFVADSSMDIAANIISDVSLGRGSQLAMDIGFSDTRYSDVTLLRPMRDFTKEEISQYLACYNLDAIKFHKPTEKRSTASIQQLSNNFVTQLESGFQGTVSTIFRTGEKISTELSVSANISDNCVLCEIPLDTKSSEDELCAIQATAFSKSLSFKGPCITENNPKHDQQLYELGDEAVQGETINTYNSESNDKTSYSTKNIKHFSKDDLEKYLCHGCRLTFQGSNLSESIPLYIKNAVESRMSIMSMQNEIADFLL